MLVVVNYTRNVDSNDSAYSSSEELRLSKAANSAMVLALKEAKLYTDKEIDAVNKTFEEHKAEEARRDDIMNKKLDIILEYLLKSD